MGVADGERGDRWATDIPKVLRFSIDIKSVVAGVTSDDDVDSEM